MNMNEKFELIQRASRDLWSFFDTDDLQTVVGLIKERAAASNALYHARARRKTGDSEASAKVRVKALWKTPPEQAVNLSDTGKPGIETADEVRPRRPDSSLDFLHDTDPPKRSRFPEPFTEDDDFGV